MSNENAENLADGLNRGEANPPSAHPRIVFHPSEYSAGPFEYSSEAFQPSAISHSSDDDSTGESIDLESSAYQGRSAVDGLVLPSSIPCSLFIIFAGTSVPEAVKELTVPLDNSDSYGEIERLSQDHAKDTCQEDLTGREVTFRYGNCTIIGEVAGKTGLPLTSRGDWDDVSMLLKNYWTSNPHQSLRLEITRNYYAFRYRATSEVSLAGAKRTEIHTLMKRAADNRLYLSREDLISVSSQDTIRNIIMSDHQLNITSDEKENFILRVQSEARKLLVMCVLAPLGMGCLKQLLDNGRSDKDLPLKFQHCCHAKCAVDFENLTSRQGGFLTAEFWKIGQHQRLHSSIVVPIHFFPTDKKGEVPREKTGQLDTEDTDNTADEENLDKKNAWCGSGAYSNVYRIRLDPSHHRLSKNKDADFALKEFKDRPKTVGPNFTQELKTLDELRNLSQRYLVTHLTSWTQNGRYCMLFPYAQCNLREYMKYMTFGDPTKGNIMWLLRQFRGLAAAMKDIHNLSLAIVTPKGSSLQAPKQERRAGWHHDIKPENILYFTKAGLPHGTFKVADFGSSKIQTYRSGSINTRSPIGTLTYEPPEAKKEGATSRPYDIWSLGCVFLELLVWAVSDYRSLKTFTSERVGRRAPGSKTDLVEDDGFWQMAEDGTVKLRPSVVTWIENLRGKILQQERQPFKEVLELVMRMLDTNRSSRIIALDVWNTLDIIYKQKTVDLDRTVNMDMPIPRPYMNPIGYHSPGPANEGPPSVVTRVNSASTGFSPAVSRVTTGDRLSTSPTDSFGPLPRRASTFSVTSPQTDSMASSMTSIRTRRGTEDEHQFVEGGPDTL